MDFHEEVNFCVATGVESLEGGQIFLEKFDYFGVCSFLFEAKAELSKLMHRFSAILSGIIEI